jgi:hypothetical protein
VIEEIEEMTVVEILEDLIVTVVVIAEAAVAVETLTVVVAVAALADKVVAAKVEEDILTIFYWQ